MKLYGSLTSPFVRKLRVLLHEKPMACELVVADPGGTQSPVPRLNPLAKVPVLERDDGSVLFDSPVIFEFLDAQREPSLLAPAGETRWQILLWQALADGIMDATVAHMLEARRDLEHQSSAMLARQADKIEHGLGFADARVPESGPIVGERFSLADIALVSAIDYLDLRMPHPWRAKYPKLASWHAAMAERPSFVATRPPGLSRPES